MSTFPPDLPVTVKKVIPAFLYQEFADDDNLQAFVASFNELAQEYVDWFNTIGLPIYTGSAITGLLLDWVGAGIYGYPRPAFATPPQVVGELAQIMPAQVEVGGSMLIAEGVSYTATDDQYKRCLTWQIFKGDGFHFSVPWLKRRLHRFLNGPNGSAPIIGQTYDVSVQANTHSFVIQLSGGSAGMRAFLAAAINTGGVLSLPFQYNFSASG